MWKDDVRVMKFMPKDGMEIVATGRIAVYAAKGKHQLYATTLQPLGVGALELAFKQLHAKLLAEGLFEAERKRELPRYPRCIGLVTSKETAALQDMLKVLRRYSYLKICIYHVPVQGDGSAEKIAAAINHLAARSMSNGNSVDVLILARGGGSLEDLWEFNEEAVARAMARCAIPIVTGIGHEIDVSIADLVADHHAHTPTEAAQVVVAYWRQAPQLLDGAGARLGREIRSLLQSARQRLAAIERHETFRRPLDRIHEFRQLLDDRQRQLTFAATGRLSNLRERIARLSVSLAHRHPRGEVALARQRVDALSLRLTHALKSDLTNRAAKVDALNGHLQAIGPDQVLKRGFSLTTVKKTGVVVRSASQLRPGDRLLTKFGEGQIESITEDPQQPKLFE